MENQKIKIKLMILGYPHCRKPPFFFRPKLKWPTVADSTESWVETNSWLQIQGQTLHQKDILGQPKSVLHKAASPLRRFIPTSVGLDFALCTNTCTTSQDDSPLSRSYDWLGRRIELPGTLFGSQLMAVVENPHLSISDTKKMKR